MEDSTASDRISYAAVGSAKPSPPHRTQFTTTSQLPATRQADLTGLSASMPYLRKTTCGFSSAANKGLPETAVVQRKGRGVADWRKTFDRAPKPHAQPTGSFPPRDNLERAQSITASAERQGVSDQPNAFVRRSFTTKIWLWDDDASRVPGHHNHFRESITGSTIRRRQGNDIETGLLVEGASEVMTAGSGGKRRYNGQQDVRGGTMGIADSGLGMRSARHVLVPRTLSVKAFAICPPAKGQNEDEPHTRLARQYKGRLSDNVDDLGVSEQPVFRPTSCPHPQHWRSQRNTQRPLKSSPSLPMLVSATVGTSTTQFLRRSSSACSLTTRQLAARSIGHSEACSPCLGNSHEGADSGIRMAPPQTPRAFSKGSPVIVRIHEFEELGLVDIGTINDKPRSPDRVDLLMGERTQRPHQGQVSPQELNSHGQIRKSALPNNRSKPILSLRGTFGPRTRTPSRPRGWASRDAAWHI